MLNTMACVSKCGLRLIYRGYWWWEMAGTLLTSEEQENHQYSQSTLSISPSSQQVKTDLNATSRIRCFEATDELVMPTVGEQDTRKTVRFSHLLAESHG